MSSANKKNNGSLEDSLRNRLQDAEATPAPDLWERIDHDLTVQENLQYKKRVVFYRQLAAACFVLFVMAGSLLAYQFSSSEDSLDNMANQEEVNSNIPELAQADEDAVISAEPAITPNEIDNAAVASADISQNNGENESAYQETKPSLGIKSVAKTGLEKQSELLQVVANAETESRDRDKDQLPENVIAAGSEPQQAAGIAGLQKNETIARQPVILKNPTVLSLMDRNQQKSGILAQDSEPENKKQASILARELNADVKENESDEVSGSNRWSISMAYVPTYFAQNIGLPDPLARNSRKPGILNTGPAISEESSSNMEKARDEYENNTAPAYSYSVDIRTGFKVGKKLKLLSGIGFTQNTARTNTNYVVEQHWSGQQASRTAPIPPTTVFLTSLNNDFTTDSVSVSQTEGFDVDHRYRMISLPIGLQFESGIANGWDWYMTGGVAANIMIQSSIISSRQDIASVSFENQDESPFRRTQFSGNVGLGLSKQVTDAISLSIGPEFRGFLNTMLSEPDDVMASQGKPYAIGMNMSLNYKLGH